MNQARKRPMHQKVLSMILVLVMLLGLLSVSAFTMANTTSSDSADSTDFMRIFHLDCGRKYFSVAQIEELIDTASEAGYTHMELAIGNDALRFLLDDMSVTANGTTYSSDKVKAGIQAGNKTYYNAGSANELTQSEMNGIIKYAKGKNISIIPLLNSPGHMDAIIDCMESLGMSNVAYNSSTRTISLTNNDAVAFAKALIEKYVKYFASKGCTYFNMGADEYANDVSNGFAELINNNTYRNFVTYVNAVAGIIDTEGMTPIAFNDGIYYNSNTSGGEFDERIVISYWTSGWNGYTPASASFLAGKGHKIINTNDAWYYVLGREAGNQSGYTIATAKNGVKGTVVTDVPGNNDSAPIGAMMCLWCDSPSASYNANEQNNVKTLIQTLAENNPTYFTKSTPTDPDSGTTEDGVIEVEVPVGSDWTKTIKNVDLRNQVGDYDQSVAKVTVSYDKQDGGVTVSPVTSVSSGTAYYIQSSDGKYLDKDANWVADPASAAQWTCTEQYSGYYYLKNNSNYLRYLNGSWTTTTRQKNATSITFSDGSFSHYGYYSLGSPVTITKSDPVNASTITITGLTTGQTTVKIGEVTYHITVTDKAPSNAMTASTINLEYWITNYEVYMGESTSTEHIKAVSSSDANSDAGIAIADIAPNHAYSFFDGTKDVYYWQAMRLDADNQQTNASGDDETADGTTLTHIRYHSGAWQYKTTDGVWHYFVSTDQLVAYYLQKTEVTKEIDTYAKDWGYGTSGTTPDTSSSKGQVALTVAVVYPDGTVSPAEGKMYANSTTIFNYWDGRDIGIVAPTNNSDYNISKITVTDGERDNNSSKNVWYTNDTITWEKTTDSATGKTWYDETEVWNKSSGTTPMVNGKTSNITWSAKNTAKLVLIYLEPVERETNLNVVYWDDNANVKITGSQIAMKYTHGDPVPSFTNDLKGVTSGATSWPSNDKNSSGYLPDEAYVTNSSGVKQTFNKDLLTVSGVTGVYASGLYEYVSANISEDGKTLTLHYNLKQTDGKTYVLDFGLPIKIPAEDFGIGNYNSVSSISFDSSDTTVREKQGEYGKGKIDMSDGSVTYTLTKAIDSKVAIPIYVTFKGGQTTQRLQVYVIPATSVYYEDSFATFNDGTGAAAKAQWSIVDNDGNVTADKSAEVNQALSALGAKDIYGYDDAYKDSTKLSMGSAHKVTVSSDMADSKAWEAQTDSAWPSATFTFKGTGFDVISLTNSTSGAIFVDVYAGKEATGSPVKRLTVNNYYGYKQDENGKWVVDASSNRTLYQIPVMKVSGLDYGEYTAVIRVAYSQFFDTAKKDQYSFWLDAIRVYDPMDKDNATYVQDNEGYPQYIKLHDAIVGQTAGIQNAVFVDGGANATLTQYTNYGPNNEVYLTHGQAISFKLTGDLSSIASVQIGAKTPNGTGEAAKISVNGQEVKTATEMYYTITDFAKTGQQVTIANDGNGILSLTNLKITFNTKPSDDVKLAALTAADQESAVAQVRALFAAPAEPFQPERFEASWGHAVRKGESATLTVKASEDVEAITVDGWTITAYATKTERTGWGWWAKTVTYREFTYQVPAAETTVYAVCAVNSDGVSSDPVTATLTVRPSVRDWWHGIFDKWF